MSASSQTKLNWRVTRRNNTSGAGTRLRKPDVEASRTAKPRTQKAPPSHKEIDNDSGEGHTPVSLWSTVGYQPEGAETDMAILKAFQFAKANFVIPDDIEGERFGPLSGMTLERRVVDACLHGKLAAKAGCEDAVGVALCVTCGANGHYHRDCPAGL